MPAIIPHYKFQYQLNQMWHVEYKGRQFAAALYSKDGAIAHITLNRPDKRNAFNDASGLPMDSIVVPNWTDATNWYLMADPAQVTMIEMGFLYGKEVPDLESQENPATGMVFTNDVISFKVRWDFGGDWLDYRGAYGSIVAG